MAGAQGRDDGLVGRDDELAALAAVLDGARIGRGGALLIEGRPGTGKSALLAAADRAGLVALEVTGVESEIDLPLAGLTELLHPLAQHLPDLPEGQARLLRSALGIDAMPPRDEPPIVLLHAVLALLDLAAASRPLALFVDDVQWLDPTSRDAVAFVARRARRIGVAVLAVHSQRDTTEPLWSELPRVTVQELRRPDALTLARRQGIAPTVAEALVDAVGGNPLALIEAPAQLSADQRDGRAVLPHALPAGRRLQRLAAARIDALPLTDRDALLVAAASADGASGPIAAALAEQGGLAALALAQDHGLVEVTPQRIRFGHPSIRSSVYHAAAPSRRRAAHLALAAAIPGPESAWHRAVGAPEVDEGLAADLEALANEARRRAAPATASAVLQRAAELTPDPVAAVGRTMGAAAAAIVAGDPQRAQRLLDPLVAEIADPSLLANVQLLRGMAILKGGDPVAAYALLEHEADRIEPTNPAQAAVLLTSACVALVSHGSIERLIEVTARTTALAHDGLKVVPETLRAQALVARGEHRQAREVLAAQRDALAQIDPVGPLHELLGVVALCHLWMEDHAEADALLSHLIRHAREHGAVSALALPLAVRSGLDRRRGNWERAAACAEEAIALVDGTGHGFAGSFAFAMEALLQSQLGRPEACAAAAERVLTQGSEVRVTTTLSCAEQALGAMALAEGDAETAIVHLQRARNHQEAIGWVDPSQLYTAADLAEAHLRCGRPERTAALAEELAALAALTGGAWAEAAAARCRALTAPDEALDDLLEASLAAHARVTLPFELARTQLAFGERLRRARRRADARALLSAAHATFATLGAEAWARRAAGELAACGARFVRAPAPAEDADLPLEVLTAREREVCELVAAGATNRDIATALFLSERTVEHHLRLAYRKLGIQSRTQLVRGWVQAA